MAKLKLGAVTVDLKTGGIYGDIDHCNQAALLESAEALVTLLPKVQHEGLWALAKAYDADCYLYIGAKGYALPDGLRLEQDTGRRPFHLAVLQYSREQYWKGVWYSPLIGSFRDGKVSADIEGIPDLTRGPRMEYESHLAEIARRQPLKQLSLPL